jgi:glycine hydroxymethyltransferase
MVTSGIRLGTPAATTRGFGPAEFREVGALIGEVLAGLSQANSGDNARVEQAVHARVRELCRRFPIYPGL